METTKPKEMFHEDVKASELASKNNHSKIMDNYHNNMASVAGLYTNFFTNIAKLYSPTFHFGANGFQNNNANPASQSGKYKEVMDTHLEASKRLFNSTVAANKKMMEDAHAHFNSTVNQTQAFLSEVLKTYDKPLTEEDAYAQESGLNDMTKKTTGSANEVKDQKNK